MDNGSFKAALVKLGLSKKEFAEHIGVKQQTVNSWTSKGIPYWVEPFLTCMQNYIDCMKENIEHKATIADMQTQNENREKRLEKEFESTVSSLRKEVKEIRELVVKVSDTRP